ncbi:MAG: ATP-binding protein [bacterium]
MSKYVESFTFESDCSQFSRFYEVAGAFLQRLVLKEEERFRLLLCISEAFTNAVVHGNHLEEGKQVRVTFVWDARVLEIVIEDQGEARPEDLDLSNATPVPALDSASGRGIGLIKNYADDLKITAKPEGGLRVRIEWRFDHEKPKARVPSDALS